MLLLQPARALQRAALPQCVTTCRRCNISSSTNVPTKHKRKVIFSGIQPTGVPHLGNYLGALRQWVKLQDEADADTELFFSIVDLHAITVKQDPALLRQWRKEMLVSLYAVGLDPKRSTIFCQSMVPQHAELMWLLSSTASMGYLSRMTQWKSKLALPDNASPLDNTPNKPALKLGLFSYPVLQAADILLYQTTHVPVGEDQAQHLEFARELAASFNHTYGSSQSPLFQLPETILSPAKRVMSLTNPTKKMSKSDADMRSRILITDEKDIIEKKLKSALTDSLDGITYDREQRPGVSNLIDLMYYMDETVAASPEELSSDLKEISMRALKEKVAEAVERGIKPVRESYKEMMAREKEVAFLSQDANTAARRAQYKAADTMSFVGRAMGLGGDLD